MCAHLKFLQNVLLTMTASMHGGMIVFPFLQYIAVLIHIQGWIDCTHGPGGIFVAVSLTKQRC